jgi:hypothetical protein
MPTSSLEDEQGRWLTDLEINAPASKPGDRILRGYDTPEGVELRAALDNACPRQEVASSAAQPPENGLLGAGTAK